MLDIVDRGRYGVPLIVVSIDLLIELTTLSQK